MACLPANVITEFHFTINGKFASTLHNMVHQSDSVKAFFNIAKGCTDIPVGLVSHTLPENTFVKAHVSEQKVFDSAKGSFNAGMHTLGPINVPPCNFQIDLSALAHKGQPGHTFSSAVGGTTPCAGTTPAIMTCTTATTLGVTLFPSSPPISETFTVSVVVNGQMTTQSVTVTNAAVTHNFAVPDHTSPSVTVTNSSGETVLSQTVSQNCAKTTASVLPAVITRPATPAAAVSAPRVLGEQITTLPTTGANTGWLLALAVALMVGGCLLVFAAKRPFRSAESR
jgi:LPXTG-motif cell wall-anchored protein